MKKFAFPTVSGAIVAWVPTEKNETPYIQVLACGASITLSADDIDAIGQALAAIDEGDEHKGNADGKRPE